MSGTMRRSAIVFAIAAVALAACSREADNKSKPGDQQTTGVIAPGAEQLTELSLKVDEMDKRLKKIEVLLADMLDQPPEPDPAAVYSVPIDGDPFVGPEHAKVTIVEAWDYS